MKTEFIRSHDVFGKLRYEFTALDVPPDRKIVFQKVVFCALSLPDKISKSYAIPNDYELFRLTAINPEQSKNLNEMYINTEYFVKTGYDCKDGKMTVSGSFYNISGHALELNCFSKIHKESKKIYERLMNNQNQQSLF